MKVKDVSRTACCILVDKEEIGSVGATGMRMTNFRYCSVYSGTSLLTNSPQMILPASFLGFIVRANQIHSVPISPLSRSDIQIVVPVMSDSKVPLGMIRLRIPSQYFDNMIGGLKLRIDLLRDVPFLWMVKVAQFFERPSKIGRASCRERV